MKQRPIDLLPDSVRARSEAGVVAGRYIVAMLIAILGLGLTATHARLMLDLSRDRLEAAEEQADIVLSAEAKAQRLRQTLQETRGFIERYEMIALPLETSRILATVINMMPASATLDRIDLHAGAQRSGRSARGRGSAEADGPSPRSLNGELSGFAATDQEVAELVAALDGLGIFEQVSLDFSRTRTVRGHAAREFRISFRTDLDRRFVVEEWNGPQLETGSAHVE